MKLILAVISAQEHLEDILEAMLDLDVRGLTVIETEEVVHLLAESVPLFAGLRHMFTPGEKETNKTVFGISDRDDILDALNQALKEVGVDFSAPGIGYLGSLPVDGVVEGPQEKE